MARSFLRQTAFTAGELAPSLWGRTDLEVYGKGLRQLRNFFVDATGPVHTRAGTLYLRNAARNIGVRLVPFVYLDGQSYVLEVSDFRIRFHVGLETVLDGPSPLELVTPWNSDDVRALQWAQVGDVMTFTCPGKTPRELRRLSHASWTLTEVGFRRPEPYFRDVDSTTRTLRPAIVGPLWDEDLTHLAREWRWRVTVVVQDVASGTLFETLPQQVVEWVYNATNEDNPVGDTTADTVTTDAPVKLVLYPDKPVTLRRLTNFSFISQPAEWDGYRTIAFNVYRGRADLYGFVGTTTSREFVDVGDEPNYERQPPRGTNPFAILTPLGATQRIEPPTAVAFFEERRLWGGFASRPTAVLASATGDYYDHDVTTLHRAGEALDYELANRRREAVVNMVALRRLLIGTDTSVWSFGGSGGPLDFDSVEARVEVETGVKPLPWLVLPGVAIAARRKGGGVLGLRYSQEAGGFEPLDIGANANHLFRGYGPVPEWHGVSSNRDIVEWAYAEDPWGVVWAVRRDGTLVSLTLSPERGVIGWARHDTLNGVVLSVCAVPGVEEDEVYIAVRRQLSTGVVCTIERMASRVRRGTPDDDCAVDCGVRYSGPVTDTFTGLQHLAGAQVYLCAVGNGPQLGTVDGAGSVTFERTPEANDGSNLVAYIGVPFVPEFETLDAGAGDARARQKTVVSVGLEVTESRGVMVGQDWNDLVEWTQREVSDSYGVPSAATTFARIMTPGGWDAHGRAVVRQTLPLPLSVVGLTREVDAGGA